MRYLHICHPKLLHLLRLGGSASRSPGHVDSRTTQIRDAPVLLPAVNHLLDERVGDFHLLEAVFLGPMWT